MRSFQSFASALLLTLVATTGCSEGITDPVDDNEEAVYVMTFPAVQSSQQVVSLFFGTEIKYWEWNLGLEPVKSPAWITTHGVVLESSQTIALAAVIAGAGGVKSDGTASTSYRFLTDWAPAKSVGAGVWTKSSSELSFIILKSVPNSTQPAHTATEVISRSAPSGRASHLLEFPADDTTRYVFPRQIYQVGCRGSGTMTFKASQGLSEVIVGAYSSGKLISHSVQEIPITCTQYENVAKAQMALAGM